MPTLKQLWNKLCFILQIPFDTLAKRLFRDYFFKHYHVYGDPTRLKIASTAVVSNASFNLSSGTIFIEDYVFFGSNVSVITGIHDIKKMGLERQLAVPTSGRDITIKRGAWIASNVTILGPCTIGENAVVGACCLIRHDVPANTVCYAKDTIILKPLSLPHTN
ncbi:MAG: acyltransferase [Candidatus Bathyarchaeia archaeon]|jgi:acetyltransferase-like isoleucine patch superfamily enzyme